MSGSGVLRSLSHLLRVGAVPQITLGELLRLVHGMG
jgi:hypothetical protein